jgi:hypothetical protein
MSHWRLKLAQLCAAVALLLDACLQTSVLPAMAQDNAAPPLSASDLYPMQPEPEGFLTNVKSFNDPLCLQWTNQCDKCVRDRKELGRISCTPGPPECHRKYVDCVQPNSKLIFSFCKEYYADSGRNTETYSQKPTPALGRFPSTQLVVCTKFK